MKITNPLKVTEEDTVGSAIIKKATEGYVKTMVTGLVGLGVLTVGIMKLNDIANNEEEETEEQDESSDEEMVKEVMEDHGFVEISENEYDKL